MRSEYIDRNRERSFKVLILVLRICEDILKYLIYMFDIAGGRIKKCRIIGREISDGKLKLPSQLLVQIHPKFWPWRGPWLTCRPLRVQGQRE